MFYSCGFDSGYMLRQFAEAFVVENSGMAGFAGDDALRAVSFGCRQARR